MDGEPDSDILKMDLSLDGDDWKPTPHGECLARAIAENLIAAGRSVLEIGAGVGNHTIVLARQGPTWLVTTEITESRLETARGNVERNFPDAEFIEYRVADWLNTEGTFDLIVTNPPFCQSGKRNRRYFIDLLILDAHKRLSPGGMLVFVQSSMADLQKTQRRLEENGFEHGILGQSEGPFRDYYFEDASFMEEIQTVPNGFEIRSGVPIETLYVIQARLLPWAPGLSHAPE